MAHSKKQLVTVVTVCFNAEQFIEKTMKSILEQTYDNIEYIVKDGVSTDQTNEIVESYRKRFEQRGIQFWHVIQEDGGIYDAMNQATDLASGEYINYMNADDTFLDNNVLQDIFGDNDQTADLLYGDSVWTYEYVRGKKRYSVWKGQHECFDEMPFGHQACFFKTEIIKKYHYNCKYRIAGDFQIISRFWVDNKSFCNVGRIISVCTMGGISNIQMEESYKESIQLKKELNMEKFLVNDTILNLQLVKIKQWIVKNMPGWIVWRLTEFQLKRNGKKIYMGLEEITDD